MNRFSTIIGVFVLGVAFACIIAVLVSLPMMWLWNYVMPYMFGLREIDLWHAMGLAFLCQLMFKSSLASSKGSK